MNSTGWEIRPLGWIVLAAALGVVICIAIRWLRHPPQKAGEKN